jgi:chromosome segregation ATPase
MPMTLYDEAGNAKEVPTDEEIAAQLGERDKKLNEVTEKLAKLENKDFNFKRLKDMTEQEREKLSAIEVDLKQRQEKLEDEQRSFVERQVNEHKNDALNVLAGDDKDLREKIEFHFSRIKDEAVTREEINKKMREAATLATGHAPDTRPSQLSSAMGLSGAGMRAKPKDEEITPDLKDLGAKFGLTDEDYKR